MSHQQEFDRRLNRLYLKRTAWLRTVLTKPHPGPITKLKKKQREDEIKHLQRIASDALARKFAKRQFEHSVVKRKSWRVKGRGPKETKKTFKEWAKNKIDQSSGKVYVFWRKKKCCYVGRTLGRGSRPSSHFKKHWFKESTRIVVYMAAHKRDVPRLECLAVHRFLPAWNQVRAARKSWTPNCPLCKLHQNIKTELRTIFRFR